MTAIGDYFRTALLIDDRAFDTTSYLESAGPEPAGYGEPTSGLEAVQDEEASVDWNSIVHAFLQEKVVCSVLRPDQGEDISELIVRGSKIADLLILDWDFFDDNGQITIEAIREIALSDAPRVKVLKAIVIYTEISFDSIIDALVNECELVKDKESDFVFSKDATLVMVFGKSSIRPMEGEEEGNRIASYSELPTKIRQDLEDHFGGLAPELAFSAINIIRESAPRILATFDSSLDAPLLTHRALLPDVSDIGSQFIRLLTNEFEVSLVENFVADLLEEDFIRERLELLGIIKSPEKLAMKLKNSPKVTDDHKKLDDSELVKESVTIGLREMGLSNSKLNQLVDPLVRAFDVSDEYHKSLAILMCSTQFGNISPRLEAGIVLEKVEQPDDEVCEQPEKVEPESKYWLCIQPLCDSVRLSGPRKFPLLPLIVQPDGSAASKKASPDAMIRAADGVALPIRFSSSIHDLEMPEFEPAEGESSVTAQKKDREGKNDNGWYFKDTGGERYRAVCRLRTEFTQQAVQGLTSGVARPGVDSSEWLRRQG